MILNTQIITQKVGSSETICKTPLYTQVFTQPFNFVTLINFIPQHIKPSNYSPEFLSWFIGFSEGDGSFIVGDDRLFFIITQKDVALLHRIRTQLGFGLICNDENYPEIKRYVVTDRSLIEILIHIFNGNLVLKKTTTRFSKWLDTYNRVTGQNIPMISRWNPDFLLLPETNFSNSREKLSLETIQYVRTHSVVWNSSWFTGFLEAEGGFSAVQRFKHKTDHEKTTEMRFLLDQTNELEVLTHIRDLLGDSGCIWIRKKSPEKIHYRFDLCNFEALNLLVKYLTSHPLRSKKKIVYVRWQKILNYLDLIQESKKQGTFVYSEKRQQRINRLVLETKKEFLEQQRVKKVKKEVEDRVQTSLKNEEM